MFAFKVVFFALGGQPGPTTIARRGAQSKMNVRPQPLGHTSRPRPAARTKMTSTCTSSRKPSLAREPRRLCRCKTMAVRHVCVRARLLQTKLQTRKHKCDHALRFVFEKVKDRSWAEIDGEVTPAANEVDRWKKMRRLWCGRREVVAAKQSRAGPQNKLGESAGRRRRGSFCSYAAAARQPRPEWHVTNNWWGKPTREWSAAQLGLL